MRVYHRALTELILSYHIIPHVKVRKIQRQRHGKQGGHLPVAQHRCRYIVKRSKRMHDEY